MIFNYKATFISLLSEYIYLYIPLCLSVLICVLLFSVVTLITYKQYDLEKISAYECGFHPYEDTREKFNIRFYLVSILFIIFDLEITFLFPWAVSLTNSDLLGFWAMFIFLVILTIGFIYEWVKGALDWE
jgi:NADH:ubiquinone oxidoreductase subunit 3 (subunit A)